MEEKLIKYVMEKADQCYSDDFPIQNIEIWIREFFIQYQPERLSEKTLYEEEEEMRLEEIHFPQA
jgi:hypothetical protein